MLSMLGYEYARNSIAFAGETAVNVFSPLIESTRGVRLEKLGVIFPRCREAHCRVAS